MDPSSRHQLLMVRTTIEILALFIFVDVVPSDSAFDGLLEIRFTADNCVYYLRGADSVRSKRITSIGTRADVIAHSRKGLYIFLSCDTIM